MMVAVALGVCVLVAFVVIVRGLEDVTFVVVVETCAEEVSPVGETGEVELDCTLKVGFE